METPSFHSRAQEELAAAPSTDGDHQSRVTANVAVPQDAESVGVLVAVDESSTALGLDVDALKRAGFHGRVGQTLVIPRQDGPPWVAVGLGSREELSVSRLRDVGSAFARAAGDPSRLALWLTGTEAVPPRLAAQALTEGVLLARYRYRALKTAADHAPPLQHLALVVDSVDLEEVELGVRHGVLTSQATELARDLSEAPASLLTARRMADVARTLARQSGLEIEVHDGVALAAMGCGGILGVNAGSTEPPQMIKLTYRPRDEAGEAVEPIAHVSLVGKGIMFDSGGLGIKPNDLVHATMKSDMSGAGAILAAMTALRAFDCPITVTAYLMCTDNMPSGTAMRLGDVLTVRGGTTVEVLNTDAEGRLVMSDALVLSTEQVPRPDAILDLATLTGACQRALGRLTAGVIGNDQGLVDQVRAAGERTDETVWQLPLDHRLMGELDSSVADLQNIGGVDAGAITAALFLEHFVDGIPWAHIDMAGTARTDKDLPWRPKGSTGYGTRLLIDFLLHFTPPAALHH